MTTDPPVPVRSARSGEPQELLVQIAAALGYPADILESPTALIDAVRSLVQAYKDATDDAPHTGDDDLLDALTDVREGIEVALAEMDDPDQVRESLGDAIKALTMADKLRVSELKSAGAARSGEIGK